LRKRQNFGIVLGVVAVVEACFIICGSIGPILDYFCEHDLGIAHLNAGNERIIAISAEPCWEVGRALRYEVSERGIIISRKFLLEVDIGSERHSYTLIYAENRSLVGVLDTVTIPPHLVAIVDFRTGQTWPHTHAFLSNQIQRLQQEHPQLELSSLIQ
jgi:hypothetical protein